MRSLCAIALLAAVAAGQTATINYPDFSNIPNLQLNGNAVQVGNAIEVTPAAQSQGGTVYETNPFIVVAGFDMAIEFQMDGQLNGGGDGMALIFQNDPRGPLAIGQNGGEMGYGAGPTAPAGTAIANALVIELDTYQSGLDLSNNEVSIHTNGTGDVSQDENLSIGRASPAVDLNDGQVHVLRVRYNPGLLEVFIDDLTNPLITTPYDFTTGGTHTIPGTPVGGMNLLAGVAAFVGFSGGTGWAAEAHRVISWRTGPFGWEANSPEASLDLDGVQSNGISGPGTRQACFGDAVTVNMASTLIGNPFDVAIQVSPLGANLLNTPGGQVVNVNLFDPTLVFLNSGLPLPTFTTPFPGNQSLPIIAPPTAITIGAQMIVLDPAAFDGFHLSQGVELETIAGGSLAGPTGDDSTMNVPLRGLPLCAPSDMNFYGTVYSSIDINSNGRITFGGGDTDFSASVTEALTDNPMIGGWVDFNPLGASVINISVDPITLEVVVDYGTPTAGLVYFGGTTPNSFQVRLDTQSGIATITGLSGLTDGSAPMFLGVSGGNAVGATDIGASVFSALAGTTVNATDMVYEFGTPGPNGPTSMGTVTGPGVNTITFIPNSTGNYDWIAF